MTAEFTPSEANSGTTPVGLTTEETAAETAPTKSAMQKVAPCLGCGGYPHGSVNAEVNCLRNEIVRLRASQAKTCKETAQSRRMT